MCGRDAIIQAVFADGAAQIVVVGAAMDGAAADPAVGRIDAAGIVDVVGSFGVRLPICFFFFQLIIS